MISTRWPIALLWIGLAFLSGSIPFSLLVGRWALGVDIRNYGDGNPGGTNVLRAGGKLWGGLAVLLDALKGALPVGLAYWGMGIEGPWIVPIALAPLLGHAYSPFLHFRGGKAIATTFGIWAGLTLWQGPVALGVLLLVCYLTVAMDGWAVALTLLGYLIVLVVFSFPPLFLAVWLGNFLLVVWKHRGDLGQRPALRIP